MKPKTKVLKILDKYRDMSLALGCIFQNQYFELSPDVTTLSEIPESDKMWQAVLDVLI